MTFLIIIAGIILIYGILEYSLFIPAPEGLTVLMYHKVSESANDGLTVTTSQLERQFQYMKENGFHPVAFSDVIQKRKLPERPVVISFDDGYQNNYDLALPLLKKFGFPAVFFVATAFIGKTNAWDQGSELIMDASTLKKLTDEGPYEIGLHSHGHVNYETTSIETVEQDIRLSVKTMRDHGIPFLPALAYPYGKLPKKDKAMNARLKDILKKEGIEYAFRIGSEKNRIPLKDPYEITRTNIKGSESFFVFKIKLKKGRAKLFK